MSVPFGVVGIVDLALTAYYSRRLPPPTLREPTVPPSPLPELASAPLEPLTPPERPPSVRRRTASSQSTHPRPPPSILTRQNTKTSSSAATSHSPTPSHSHPSLSPRPSADRILPATSPPPLLASSSSLPFPSAASGSGSTPPSPARVPSINRPHRSVSSSSRVSVLPTSRRNSTASRASTSTQDGFRFAPSQATTSTANTTPDFTAFQEALDELAPTTPGTSNLSVYGASNGERSPHERAGTSFESSIRSLHDGNSIGLGRPPTSPSKPQMPERPRRKSSWLSFKRLSHHEKEEKLTRAVSASGEATPTANGHGNGHASPNKHKLAAKLREVLQ